jgi:hypothetical protein
VKGADYHALLQSMLTMEALSAWNVSKYLKSAMNLTFRAVQRNPPFLGMFSRSFISLEPRSVCRLAKGRKPLTRWRSDDGQHSRTHHTLLARPLCGVVTECTALARWLSRTNPLRWVRADSCCSRSGCVGARSTVQPARWLSAIPQHKLPLQTKSHTNPPHVTLTWDAS